MSKSRISRSTFYDTIKASLKSDCPTMEFSNKFQVGCTAQSTAVNLLGYSLFRKVSEPTKELKKQLEAQALHKFILCEHGNRLTNLRMKSWPECPAISAVLFAARRKIGNLVGGLNHGDLFRECQHGPGTTTSIREADLGGDTKYDEIRLSITRDAVPYGRVVTSGLAWPLARRINVSGPCSLMPSEFDITVGDNIAYALKTSTSLRTITVGPTVCTYLQSGAGAAFRRCLLRWGIDLTSQQTNQDLARFASRNGGLSTVDLEDASNTLSTGLVEFLLPEHIFRILDDIRSKAWKAGNRTEPYQMFSGMGNGFTFPLQTIIYHSLVVSACEYLGLGTKLCSTYGDDIVCPTSALPLIKEVFDHCGLKVNDGKTFSTGKFRESCGGQFYDGINIKPIYHRGFSSEMVTVREVCLFAHKLYLYELRMLQAGLPISFPRTLAMLRRLAFLCGEKVVPFVPVNAPTGAGFPLKFSALDSWAGLGFVFKPNLRLGRHPGLYAQSLDKIGKAPPLDERQMNGEHRHVGEAVFYDAECYSDFVGPVKGKRKSPPKEVNVVASRRAGQWELQKLRLCLGQLSQEL